MNKDIVNAKTVGGVVVGVAVGHFVIKSRSVLFLTAMGLAGGLIAYYFTKPKATNDSAKAPVTPKATTLTFMEKVEDSISDELEVDNNEEKMESFYGVNKEMLFDEQLGHTPPYNTQLQFEKPSDFMDINFNE